MPLPDQVTENNLDDIQSIDVDIDSLYQRFIGPIETHRSISAPNILASNVVKTQTSDSVSQTAQVNLNNSFVDNTNPQESRCSTFYRMLGLPVMDKDFNFYSPGFNPNKIESAKSRNARIAGSPAPNVIQLQIERETRARKKIQIFQSSILNSSLVALGQQFTKKFQILSKPNFNDLDPQTYSIPDRESFISQNYTDINGDEIFNFFEAGAHMIKPFLNNATICDTVMPANRMICAPFLKSKNDTKLEKENYLDRPGIEFILRIRLVQDTERDLVEGIVNNLDPNQDVTDISRADLSSIASALLDKNKLISDSDILSVLGQSTTEINTINNLIKMIKGCVLELKKSIDAVNDAITNIDWTPLPGELGPEDSKGMVIGNAVLVKNSTSELEKRIKQLTVKSIISQQAVVAPDAALGSFALSYIADTQKTFNGSLNDATEQKNHLISQGAAALRNIEIITGEVSGLGLIDILAVYTALWAIDLDVLLSLIDIESFQRLVANNKDLINPNVQSRIAKNNTPVISLKDAMQKFENQVKNILDFTDRLFDQARGTATVIEGGSSPTS
jgi:hypothetical protein